MSRAATLGSALRSVLPPQAAIHSYTLIKRLLLSLQRGPLALSLIVAVFHYGIVAACLDALLLTATSHPTHLFPIPLLGYVGRGQE